MREHEERRERRDERGERGGRAGAGSDPTPRRPRDDAHDDDDARSNRRETGVARRVVTSSVHLSTVMASFPGVEIRDLVILARRVIAARHTPRAPPGSRPTP